MRVLHWVTVGILIVVLSACSGCEDEDTNTPEETPLQNSVQMQLIGSTIEGITVCLDNNVCKKTDTKGMVAFETQGSYTFKIKEMNLTTLQIDQNKTVISPFRLFEDNEALAKEALLMIHAFDKGNDPSDSRVLLSFSPYIPPADSMESFIAANRVEHNLTFVINEHNNTVDFNASKLYRDCEERNVTHFDSNTSSFVTEPEIQCDEFELDIPSKDAYARLDEISAFITLAEEHNVTLDGLETKYLLKQDTLTSFTLGENFRFTFFAEKQKVVVEIYDAQSRTTEKATLLESDEPTILLTNLTEIEIAEE